MAYLRYTYPAASIYELNKPYSLAELKLTLSDELIQWWFTPIDFEWGEEGTNPYISYPPDVFIFHNTVTSIGNGTLLKADGNDAINIAFSISDGGSFTAYFEGQIVSGGSWYPVDAMSINDNNICTYTSDATDVYQIHLREWTYIRVRISALSGTLTCIGKKVNSDNVDITARDMALDNSTQISQLDTLKTKARTYARNRHTNPQSKGGAVSSSSAYAASEITSGLPDGFTYGTKTIRQYSNNAVVSGLYFGPSDGSLSDAIPVTPGEVISIGLYIWTNDNLGGTGTIGARVRPRYYDANNALISTGTAINNSAIALSTWELRVQNGITVPANATHMAIEGIVGAVSGGTSTTGSETRMTGAIIVSGTMIPEYGDGTFPYWVWNGAEHASTSARIWQSDEEVSMPIKLVASGNTLIITETVNGKSLVTTASKVGSKNFMFNFSTLTYDGASISTVTDDIPAIRTQMGTIGANHGFTCIGIFNNPDSKTISDIGSVWTDGMREYVLFGLTSDNRLKIGGSYSGTPVISENVSPITNLTHVSGATHTGTIDYTTLVAGSSASSDYMLTPGTNTRRKLNILMDGADISSDGTYYGHKLTIREAYEIVDYASLYDVCKANIGTAITSLTVEGSVLVHNIFEWTGAGRIRVINTLDELKPTTLEATNGIVAAALSRTGYTTRRYIPGTGVVGGFNWSNGVDLTSYSSNVITQSTDLLSTGQVSAFSLDTLDLSGVVNLGFAIGYEPNRTSAASRSARRLTNSSTTLWDMRNTKKCYPTYTTGEDAGWGHIEVTGYRCYLSPSQVSEVLSYASNAIASYAALATAMDLPIL